MFWAKWQPIAAVCIVLIAATIAAYWPVLACDFISLDDADYVYNNQRVLAGLSLSGWKYAFTTWDCSNWHPLTWLSLELDGTLCGKNPAGYHATNMLLHALNSVIVFLVFAHAHYADAQMAKGNYEQAIFHIENVVNWKRSGYASNAYWNWGRCLVELNRPAEAEQKFLMALQVDPNHEAALEEMAKLLKAQGRTGDAAQYLARHTEAFRRRISQMPENAAVQFKLGMLMAQQGNAKQAAIHFEKAVELAPQSAEARNNLGLVQMQLNRRQDAKVNFLQAIELNHQLGIAHFYLANLLEAENDLAGAKEHFAEAVRINPQDVKAKQSWDRLNNR